MKKIILNVFACITFVVGIKQLAKSKEINAGYYLASSLTSNGGAQNFGAGAGGAAGWLGAQALGRVIGGTVGACIGGPFGVILGAGIGAA